jgi:septal ring factor EnvC (AmiA/AmiB activator)
MEERLKILEERRCADRVRAIEGFQGQLGLSEAEWTVVRPRLEKVYDLVHPLRQVGRSDEAQRTDVERRSAALREVLADEKADAERIKAALTALRLAKEKTDQELARARHALRQLMTLRQEAQLVLSGLLD